MKKKVLLILTIFLLAFSLSACSDEGITFETESFTPKGVRLSGIEIRAANREILIIPSNDKQIHIDYAENAKEFYDISVSESGILTMVSKSDTEWTDYIGVNKSADASKSPFKSPMPLFPHWFCAPHERIYPRPH